jgi:hypothetical protein
MMDMSDGQSVNLAVQILEQKGFKNIEVVRKAYDIEAERDGIKFGIEVKTANIGFSGSWSQLKTLYHDHYVPKEHRALLMFVNEDGWYCIFQMTDALVL